MGKARRGRGEGAVFFDRTLGLWTARIDLGVVDGRRCRRKVTAKTKAEALAKMRGRSPREGPGAGGRRPSAPRANGSRRGSTTSLPGTVAASTEAHYGQVVRDWVVPYVGDIPLAELEHRGRRPHGAVPGRRRPGRRAPSAWPAPSCAGPCPRPCATGTCPATWPP